MKVPSSGGSSVIIAGGQFEPYGIAVDENNVYWTDAGAGTVMAASISGGNPTTLASRQASPGDIAVDATNVYWIDAGLGPGDGRVMSIAKPPPQAPAPPEP